METSSASISLALSGMGIPLNVINMFVKSTRGESSEEQVCHIYPVRSGRDSIHDAPVRTVKSHSRDKGKADISHHGPREFGHSTHRKPRNLAPREHAAFYRVPGDKRWTRKDMDIQGPKQIITQLYGEWLTNGEPDIVVSRIIRPIKRKN